MPYGFCGSFVSFDIQVAPETKLGISAPPAAELRWSSCCLTLDEKGGAARLAGVEGALTGGSDVPYTHGVAPEVPAARNCGLVETEKQKRRPERTGVSAYAVIS
jgi:hypothetical protein